MPAGKPSPQPSTSSSSNIAQQSRATTSLPPLTTANLPSSRRESFPPHTPSALSIASSPAAGTSSPVVKRPLAPATDGPGGGSRPPGPERKQPTDSRSQSIVDPATGKKKRISLSCAQCAKRKQKCNREYPCQHCLARKVPELCVPYQPAPSNANTAGLDQATVDRIDRIENVLSVVVRHNPGIGGYEAVREWLASSTFQRFLASAPSTPASPSSLIPQQLHRPPPLPQRQKTIDGQHPIPPEEMENMERGGSSEEDGGRVAKGWLGDLEGGMPESMKTDENITIRVDVHGTPAENLQRLITDCGVSPHKVQELIQELPPKPFADRVIDWYFTHLNLVRYPIDERLFRISYEDLYNKTTAVDPANVRALPLVFIVLAMAVRLAPDHWAGDDNTRKISSLRMYWSSRRSILIATAIQSESIELVLTRLLSAMYLVQIHDRRLTECWSQLGASLRTAQAIGLHRDGSKMGLDSFQTEYRRRLWSYLYHADRLYSLILGRPPSISDAYTDSLPPSNVDLNEYDLSNPSAPPPPPRPLSEPTTATFLILRRHLSGIIGRIVHHFQKLNEPAQYADVQRLQEELDSFTANLPKQFRMRDPDKSLDKQYYWLPVHRFMLLTEVLVTTIILHRPWLLRRLTSNRYLASRSACFESAKLDFQIRQEFQREVPNFGLYAITGQFKMFNSAMIAGISAIIDPRGPDADQMRRILTTFLEQHPWSEVAALDETTRKEVQIIHTLSRRAAQIFEDTMAPGELNAQDKDSVSLLLALRQGEVPGTSTYASPVAAMDTGTPRAGMTPNAAGMGGPLSSSSSYARAGPFAHAKQQSTSGGAPGTSWAKYMSGPHSGAGGMMQSPASSGGHEEDHSQRLLDHWLSTNSTLAGGVGGLTGAPTGLDGALGGPGFMGPMAPMAGLGVTPLPSTPGFPGAAGATPGPGPVSMGGASGMGGFIWGSAGGVGDETLGGVAHHNSVGDTTFSFPPPSAGLDGTVLGVPGIGGGGMAGGMEGAGENSDEYWNTLIDGILGTTGGMVSHQG